MKKRRRSLEINFHGSPTVCILRGAPRLRLLSQQAAKLTIANVGDKFEHSRDWRGYGGLQTCSCCVPSRHMGAVKRLFSRNDSKFARSIKELTLSGYFPYQGSEDECSALSSHSFLHKRRFQAMRLETFKVELDWNDWDFEILYGMLWARSCARSVTNLKVLKLPISLPPDCIRLGQALHFMPRLVSLTITDVPDREEFLTYLGYLGKGILCCASTLRELNIEMTNFNRPSPWERNERFIEPDDKGFFFRKLFPCPLSEELRALFERELRDGTDPITEAPLSLTKLRLKHVSLPWYSFGITFNAQSIKHLHLPYSTVDEIVWQLLGLYAQLDTLTHISYDMLSAEFLGFLEEESSLKELSFARPQDRYNTTGVTFFGSSSHMMIRVSEEAPTLGPDTGAGYPGLDKFLSSLMDMKMLKHLVLPMDMYTITPECLMSIAAWLTGLEHLELGFDYNDVVRARTFPLMMKAVNVDKFLRCRSSWKNLYPTSYAAPQP